MNWCNDNQLKRYQEYNKTKPVFLLLGVGDDAKIPEAVSLIPLSQARYTGLFLSVLERFEIHPNKPITSKDLWGR